MSQRKKVLFWADLIDLKNEDSVGSIQPDGFTNRQNQYGLEILIIFSIDLNIDEQRRESLRGARDQYYSFSLPASASRPLTSSILKNYHLVNEGKKIPGFCHILLAGVTNKTSPNPQE
jgi:hypothetical protein